MQSYVQAMALKSQMQQQQMGNLEIQQKQMDLQDQQNLRQAYQQSGGDLDKFSQLATQKGVSPKAMFAVQQSITQQKQAYANLQKDQLDLLNRQAGTISDVVQNLQSMPDDNARAAAWDGARETLRSRGGVPVGQLPETYPGPDWLQKEVIQTTSHKQLLDQAQAEAESKAKVGEQQSQTALNTAKTPGAQAESTRQQMVAQMMQKAQAAQQSGQHPIDAILGQVDPQAAAAYKPAYDTAMAGGGPEAAKSILEAAATHAGQISIATNPTVQQSKVDEAHQIAVANAPTEVAKAVATAKALRMGDNAAVAGVAPAAVTAVQNSAMKLDQDYAGAKAATETLGRVLDLAGQGNAAAGANVAPLGAAGIAAVNGIKRLNPSLVESYGNAGSILQDIQGKLSHWEGTGPLPKGLLDEVRELHQTIGQQAYQTYTDNLNSLNTRSGSKFQPTLGPPNISKAGGIPPAVQSVLANAPAGIHKLSDGTTWVKAADGTITQQQQ